jgi:hypothetical protein
VDFVRKIVVSVLLGSGQCQDRVIPLLREGVSDMRGGGRERHARRREGGRKIRRRIQRDETVKGEIAGAYDRG